MTFSHSTKADRPRPGFTLVELLVVIAIIGVLVAILLPAVQRVRESARRAACSNNGRQCGLAVHNFLSTQGRFPRGQGDETIPSVTHKNSWIVTLLPYLEESARYDEWAETTNAAATLEAAPISTLECASNSWAASAVGRSTYKVISNWGAVYGNNTAHTTAYGANAKGIVASTGGQAPVTRDNVKDGLSNTAMFGEIATHDTGTNRFLIAKTKDATRKQCLESSSIFVISTNGGGYDHSVRPFNPNYARVNMTFIPNSRMCGFPGCAGEQCMPVGGTCVASWHPGGAHVVMGDGAVKFVDENVDCGEKDGDRWEVLWATAASSTNPKGVWGDIATRAGGESGKLP